MTIEIYLLTLFPGNCFIGFLKCAVWFRFSVVEFFSNVYDITGLAKFNRKCFPFFCLLSLDFSEPLATRARRILYGSSAFSNF